LNAIGDESGWNPNWAPDQPSSSPSLREDFHRYSIVVIEDNPADAFLVQEAITTYKVHANVLVVRDGEDAIRLIDRVDNDDKTSCPELFLLDLNIPTKNGEEVLSHIRNSRRCNATPVVVVTSSDSPRDRARTNALGANRYFRKPSDYDSFIQLGEVVREVLEV
jgi:CheY-like chemotaxis protein